MAILPTAEADKLPTADVELGAHPQRLELERALPAKPRARHYLALTDHEREQGYVRPLWHSWQHALCGSVQPFRWADAARELARNPPNLNWKGQKCQGCHTQVPFGGDGYAFWVDTLGRVTPVKVGT